MNTLIRGFIMKNIAYIRVSTIVQNTTRQLQDLEFDETFTDKVSGKDNNRPALMEMIKFVREGDIIHVHDLSRLGRNIKELRNLIDELINKGVTVKFHKEQLTFNNSSDAMSKLLLNMLGAVYEFEREVMLERQREGIAIAKAEGKYKGRKPTVDSSEILKLIKKGVSIRKVAAELGIGISTVMRAKKS